MDYIIILKCQRRILDQDLLYSLPGEKKQQISLHYQWISAISFGQSEAVIPKNLPVLKNKVQQKQQSNTPLVSVLFCCLNWGIVSISCQTMGICKKVEILSTMSCMLTCDQKVQAPYPLSLYQFPCVQYMILLLFSYSLHYCVSKSVFMLPIVLLQVFCVQWDALDVNSCSVQPELE